MEATSHTKFSVEDIEPLAPPVTTAKFDETARLTARPVVPLDKLSGDNSNGFSHHPEIAMRSNSHRNGTRRYMLLALAAVLVISGVVVGMTNSSARADAAQDSVNVNQSGNNELFGVAETAGFSGITPEITDFPFDLVVPAEQTVANQARRTRQVASAAPVTHVSDDNQSVNFEEESSEVNPGQVIKDNPKAARRARKFQRKANKMRGIRLILRQFIN